jgi:hypothetical protein
MKKFKKYWVHEWQTMIWEASTQGRKCDRSSQKSDRNESAEQTILQATEHKILKVKLYEHAYKINVVQILQEEDNHVRINLC